MGLDSSGQALTVAALAPSSVEVLQSIRHPSQPGLLIERHRYMPGARGYCDLECHVVVVTRTPITRGERGNGRGGFVPFVKTHGATTIIPASGGGPPTRLMTAAEVLICAIRPDAVQAVVAETEERTLANLDFVAGIHDRDLLDLLRMLGREINTNSPSGTLYTDSLAFSLLARVIGLASRPSRPLFATRSALGPRQRQRVSDYIDAHLERKIGLQDLANHLGYSRGHFLRMFRNATGTTPHQYLSDRRVERAKALLSEGDMSLSEVALACGFSSQSHLATEFRRRVGTSPGRYRRGR
jgi:AraC family transcriptional regulator